MVMVSFPVDDDRAQSPILETELATLAPVILTRYAPPPEPAPELVELPQANQPDNAPSGMGKIPALAPLDMPLANQPPIPTAPPLPLPPFVPSMAAAPSAVVNTRASSMSAFPPGNEIPGSSDPKTAEQVATLSRIIMPNSSQVRPEYRAWILGPDGSLTNDLSRLNIPPARLSEINAILAAGTDLSKPSGGYLLAVNTDGVPIQYIGVQPTQEVIAALQADTRIPQADRDFLNVLKQDAPTASDLALARVRDAIALQARDPNPNRQMPDVVAQGRTAEEKAPLANARNAAQPGWQNVTDSVMPLPSQLPTAVAPVPIPVPTTGVTAGAVVGKEVGQAVGSGAAGGVVVAIAVAFAVILVLSSSD